MKVYRYAIAMAILLQPGHVEASSTNPIAPPALLSSSDPAAARTPAAPQDPSAAADAFATELKLRPDQKAAYDAWLASGAPDPAAQAADAAERERALDSMPHFHAYM
jgi:hypothetical protein